MTILDLVRPSTTLRSRYFSFTLLPLVVAIGLAVVGGFGSYVTMGLPVRLLHFSLSSLAIGALAFALSESLRRGVFAGALPFWAALVVAVATAPFGALMVQQSLRLWAPHALRYVSFGELFTQVTVVNLVIGAATWVLFRQARGVVEGPVEDAQPGDASDARGEFRAKLPAALRNATIIALSAEDHYVRVRTDRGQALILMNLARAILALGPEAGVRIHRSHWVAHALAVAACGSRRDIRLDADTVLPVSRAGRKLLNNVLKEFA